MTLSPFNAWVVLKGLETLGIRMQAQSANALALARWLEAHPHGRARLLPGPRIASAARARDGQQSGSGGAVVSFDVQGRRRRGGAHECLPRHRQHAGLSIATNLGDTKTIVTHPATTSHGRLSEEQRQAAGIGQGLIRVAVGLEHIDDVKADLSRGLDTL